jgi:hypothetical protein
MNNVLKGQYYGKKPKTINPESHRDGINLLVYPGSCIKYKLI